ncbi:MAG: TIGR02678 family protein [Ruminococcus flavefaciens]|nr:TIGR02678 family protein [Ruminococcus flavefaciens]
MYEFRALLDRFWITRTGDRELYFTLKRVQSDPDFHRLVNELLGWNLIVNESVIKLEKVPPRAMPWMGIQSFQEPLDYCLLCAVLLFLADQDDGAPFLLSSLTQAVETFLSEIQPVDWTRFLHRKSLVRVLQYAQEVGLVLVYDGNSALFGNDQSQEVLYENTGLSRHFPVHFGQDIMKLQSVEDFEALAWEGDETEQRRQRVYRQLALTPGLYCTDQSQSDYDYIKNQRKTVNGNLDRFLNGELQLYKNGAFFLLSEGERCGALHPGARAVSDVALLLCAQLREQIAQGIYPRQEDDTVLLTHREFRYELSRCRDRCGNGWGAQLRGCSLERICQELTDYMSSWMLLEVLDGDIRLYPAVGKLVGVYPTAYKNELGEVAEDEPLEDE